MLLPSALYPHAACIAKHLPHLHPSQVQGLALWVGATILARRGCQNAVLEALLTLGLGWHSARQYLREWLRDGADRAAPCQVQLEMAACFATLLHWMLAWWEGSELTLAVDPTAKGKALAGPGRERGLPEPGDPRGLAPETGRSIRWNTSSRSCAGPLRARRIRPCRQEALEPVLNAWQADPERVPTAVQLAEDPVVTQVPVRRLRRLHPLAPWHECLAYRIGISPASSQPCTIPSLPISLCERQLPVVRRRLQGTRWSAGGVAVGGLGALVVRCLIVRQ